MRRRIPHDAQELQELLGGRDRQVVRADHRPRSPRVQLDSLHWHSAMLPTSPTLPEHPR
ncbi:hypothetical protein [Streptomyces antimycoticus]|uniref:hypothetical protein n=1 Tax=Streptomyces antimycoticus TaxID=68175 RepID=UPI00381A87C9